MLLSIFIGFLIGFLLSLRFVKRPRRALIWGLLLGGLPLALVFGPGLFPIQGIGSALGFAIFALGPLVALVIATCAAALGIAGGAAVLWLREGRARWVGWAASLALLGCVAGLTLGPVAMRSLAKHQVANERDQRKDAIVRADFEGSLASQPVRFPASPLLGAAHNCPPGVESPAFGCTTSLTNPVTILTKAQGTLLNERSDPITFRSLRIKTIEEGCNTGDFCLTQQKIDTWCSDIRPDQASSIWCEAPPPMQFHLVSQAHSEAISSPSNQSEPELAKVYAKTSLGPAKVSCFYHPDPSKTDKQGASCKLAFAITDDIFAQISASRAQIMSDDPDISSTLERIPNYWTALTESQ